MFGLTTRRRALRTRAFFTLLVVLALSAVLFTGPASSAVRYERAGERLCEIGDLSFRDGGNESGSGGDDDRWGNAKPWDGDPDTSAPEDGTGDSENGAPEVGSPVKTEALTPVYRLRVFLTWALILVGAR
jgi:hypothetical protein